MPTLVHHNQVGYIKNRNITYNIRALADILECTKRQNRAGMLVCIEFDSLEWNFLHVVLEKILAPSLSDGLTYCILVYQAVWLTMGIQPGILRWKEECVRVTHYRHTYLH